MNKQEAIEEINNLEGLTILDKTINFDSEMIPKKEVLDIVNQLDEPVRPPEPEKPVVPQLVADWYEENKDDFEYNLYRLCIDFSEQKLRTDLHCWFGENVNKPIETLVKMKLYGYEVEKEKLYTVEIPNPNEPDSGHIVLHKDEHNKVYIDWHYEDDWKLLKSLKLTEAEIKEDFDWAWQFAEEVEE